MKKLFLLTAFTALLFSCNRDGKNTSGASDLSSATTAAAQFNVKPPSSALSVEGLRLKVEAGRAQTIALPDGGSIEVPAAAFVFPDGSPVSEDVTLVYKSFITPGEIIVSGIPMKAVDAAGQEGWMQTAGMFQLEGLIEGKGAVMIAPGKELKVSMASDAPGKYDSWYFDPAAGNWVDIGDSEPIAAARSPRPATAKPVGETEGKREVNTPVKPVLLDKSKPKLNFDVNYDRFPELKALKGMVLQYAGADPAKDPANNKWIFGHEWEDVELTNGPAEGQYTLTLSGNDKTYVVPVCAALNGADYEVAMRSYEAQIAAYKKSVKAMSDRQAFAEAKSEFIRTMGIGKFGIFNFDIFSKIPENIPLMAEFDFGGENIPEERKNDVTVYLIFKGGTMVVGFDPYSWKNFSFDPKATDNRLLALLPGGKMAVLSSEKFNQLMPTLLSKRGQTFRFPMEIQDVPPASSKDLDKTLALM